MRCHIYNNSEKICKRILESIFTNYKFTKVKPDWLINPETNRNLELDLYNPILDLALEYNGHHHYNNANKNNLLKKVHKDKIKRNICKQRGTIVLVIANTRGYNNIKRTIINQLRMHEVFNDFLTNNLIN